MKKRNQRAIEIDGVKYNSMWEASHVLQIPYPTIQSRLLNKSDKFKDWRYADGENPPEGRKAPRKPPKDNCGCYQYLNLKTGHYYIGSSNRVRMRRNTHNHNLRKGNHPNKKFQEIWDNFEEDDWKITFYLTNDLTQARRMEQDWISDYWGDELLLNTSKDVVSSLHGAGSTKNGQLTDEERRVKRREKREHWNKVSKESEDDKRYGDLSPNSKPVIISGIRYPSLAVASVELGIHVTTMRTRCNSERERFKDYRWAKRGGDKGSLFPREAKEDDYLPVTAKNGEARRRNPKVPGLIVVTHVPTGKVYIGASVNVYRVVNEEEGRLRRGTHDNAALQELYDTQGKEVDVKVIELEEGVDLKTEKRSKIMSYDSGVCCNTHIHYNLS